MNLKRPKRWLVYLFAGVLILGGFGISYGALRIAGGLTIAVVGYRMLFQEARPPSVPTQGSCCGR